MIWAIAQLNTEFWCPRWLLGAWSVIRNTRVLINTIPLHVTRLLTCYKKRTILQLLLLPYFLERCLPLPDELCFYICERPIQFAWISQKRWFIELPSNLFSTNITKCFVSILTLWPSNRPWWPSPKWQCQNIISDLLESHLSNGLSQLKQNGTQEKKPSLAWVPMLFCVYGPVCCKC